MEGLTQLTPIGAAAATTSSLSQSSLASESFDVVFNQITTSNNPVALNHTLLNSIPRESRDSILASFLTSGQDPLDVLVGTGTGIDTGEVNRGVEGNTLGVLYILAARLSVPGSIPPSWGVVRDFCRGFIPDVARLAPDRVTTLAKGIVALADHMSNPKAAIQPLSDLVRRYPYDGSYLTTIHPLFALACVSSSYHTSLLPLLLSPSSRITNISLTLSPDLSYNDNLTYHYLAGCSLAALKKWELAVDYFEVVISSPGVVPAALQLEALKKLKIVQLIATGKTFPLPKYTHPLLSRLFKNTPYMAFINAYPHDMTLLKEIVNREGQLFAAEKMTGLILQALHRAPRWALKKLTGTYVTLSLAEIAKAVWIEEEDEVRGLILSMIESNDISASISADGTVTFSDPVPRFTKQQVDAVLRDVQAQTGMLSELERDVGRTREFLSKALKSREEASAWAGQTEEEVFSMNVAGSSGRWVDDAVFT